ncbi:hypothetical protein THAOC_29486, partial [Thalassiosira oceanica]
VSYTCAFMLHPPGSCDARTMHGFRLSGIQQSVSSGPTAAAGG